MISLHQSTVIEVCIGFYYRMNEFGEKRLLRGNPELLQAVWQMYKGWRWRLFWLFGVVNQSGW